MCWVLGPLGIGDAGDRVGPHPRRARQPRQRPQMRRAHPAVQLGGGDELRPPDALLASELHAAIPEDGEEDRNQPAARLEAHPGAGEHLPLDPLARLQRRRGHGDVADGERTHRAVGEADLLARVRRVAERELGLGERHHAGGVPFRARGAVPQRPGRHGDGGEGGEQHRRPEQLAPHADAVEDRLAAPERAAADAAHGRFSLIRRDSPRGGGDRRGRGEGIRAGESRASRRWRFQSGPLPV